VSWSLPEGECTSGVSFGSYGELLQGIFPDDDREFLVTLPIDRYAVAHFFPRESGGPLEVFPGWKTKSLQVASLLLRNRSRRIGGQLYLASEIPCGKGLSSSSADLVATARAIESYLKTRIPLDELCQSLSQIEPTDAVMFCESVTYCHVKGALFERLGTLPRVTILSLDEGGCMDTLECHRRGTSVLPERRREFGALLERLRSGFQRNALQEIAAVSTRSAYINQETNPKRHLERVHSICERTGGAGLVTTHSGTCLGILYDGARPGREADIARAAAELRTYGRVDIHSTVAQPVEQASTLDWSRFARD
jgi:uncharacterized protein involved in propanediol utilization